MESTQGIIIRATAYKEKDKLLYVFTPNGIITLKASGVRSAKAKLKAYAEILTFGEFTYEGSNAIKVLRSIDCTDNFFVAWSDLAKNSAFNFCFELTYKAFFNEKDTINEFVFLIKTVQNIAYGQALPIAYVLKYLVFCASRLGIDYSIIEGYNATVSNTLKSFEIADFDEIEILPFTADEIKNAVNNLLRLYKSTMGITLEQLHVCTF